MLLRGNRRPNHVGLTRKLVVAGLFSFLLTCAQDLLASGVTVAWVGSSDPSVVGYNVYYGGSSGTYTNGLNAGSATNLTVTGLTPGATYYFAATAYDSMALESDYSAEIAYSVPIPTAPRLQFRRVAGQPVTLSASVASGQTVDVLASTNLANWSVLNTFVTTTNGTFQFSDPGSLTNRARFYRIRLR